MAVGPVTTTGTVDTSLTNLVVQWRALCLQTLTLTVWANSTGDVLAWLQKKGYSNDPNPDRADNESDAAYAQRMINYLATLANIFFGNAEQTPAFPFENAMAELWGGQPLGLS